MCWRVGVDQLQPCLDATAMGDFLASQLDFLQHGISPGFIDVAHIDLHPYPAGDAVHGAWENLAYSDGPHRIARAARLRAGLHRQSYLGRRKKSIVAIRHTTGASVTAP